MNLQKFNEYHPVVNLLYIVLVLIMTMSFINPYTAGISLCISVIYGLYVFGKRFIKILLFLAIPVMIFATLIVPLFSHNGETALFYINDLPVTVETICFGLVTGMIMLSVISWFYVASSMIDTEKFLFLTGGFLPTVALIISMSLRMIPLFVKRYREVGDAQAGLGRFTEKMSPAKRVQFATKKISTVISWSLENSVNTTISMESRGYGTGKRTNAHLYKFVASDIGMISLMVVLSVIPLFRIITRQFRTDYFPTIKLTQLNIINTISYILICLLMVIPLINDVVAHIDFKKDCRRVADEK
ncbi:MAG: energy-coupling factor transporter transmembrane protein EcfT [Lachnospiraceae bacterium]|nr:energy-coupling factor transporter transmembrane protein EcfT [Lachnospiraceae bacterium]